MAFDFDAPMRGVDRYVEFASMVLALQEKINFRVSSRGWCYLMEQAGYITKAQFNKVELWINKCRKMGILPVDFVADEAARQFHGVDIPSDGSPIDYFSSFFEHSLTCGDHYDLDWWDGEKHYVQMIVEKIDLVTLFEPVCRDYHIPIANAKGWSSILQRAEYARRFKEAQDRGLKCWLLYAGDHDPDGLRISERLRKNLYDIQYIEWADGEQGYDPTDLNIRRFGLEYDFILKHKFTWIENLITGSKKNLANPKHKNHKLPYVQDYLRSVGVRKCEANVLVTAPDIAEKLCRDAIQAILGKRAAARFTKRRQAVVKYMETFFEKAKIDKPIERIRKAIKASDKTMKDLSWLTE